MQKRIYICFVFMALSVAAMAQQVQCFFSASQQTGCAPLSSISFTDLSTGSPTSHFWDFDNGNTSTLTNPATSYPLPGIYNVKHVVSNGSSTDSCFQQIRVFLPPTANFTSPNPTGCVQPCHNVSFVNQTIPGESPVVQYVWDFGDGTPAQTGYNIDHCYNATGSYDVILVMIDSNGCQANMVKNNYVLIGNQPTVTANSNPDPATTCTPPLVVNFGASGSSSNGALSYNWDFGNGTSTQQNPTQVFFSGVYNAVVTATDPYGCLARDTIVVSATNVVAGFTVSNPNACNNIPIQFTDTSNFATSWSWTFGDGGTSTQQNPSHTYAANGTYTVTLTVTYGNCTNTVTKTAYINVTSPATGSITANDTIECSAPFTPNFSSNASGAVAYNWTFGDGGTSTAANPSHTYTTIGSYTVSVQLTNSGGCVNTITLPNLIDIGTLDASFTIDSPQGCTPLTVTFTNTTTTIEPIVSYQWTFGDGGTSTQANPQHTYTGTGSFVPQLIVQTASGCRDTFVYNGFINVGQTLQPGFVATPLIQCVNQPINFSNTVTGAGAQTLFLWEFGDGQTSALANPVHQYSDTGVYTISLTVINQGCASDTERVDYILIVVPKADFYFEFDCTNPTTVAFHDTSQGADTWFWDFGDGTTSTLQNPVHTFPAQDSYVITLTVSNFTTGCVDSSKKTLPIGTPNALFFADTLQGCLPLTVNFVDSSVFASSWLWSFGDNTFSNLQNPTHTYTDTGFYTVRLIINPGQLCSDTLVRNQYIRVNGIKANFFRNPSVGCAPFAVQFNDSSKSFMGNIVSWKYRFGTGDSAMIANPTYTYNVVGNFSVTLTVTDNNGCSATTVRSINSQDIVPNFTSDTAVCPGESVQFTNTSTPNNGLSYLWHFGDGGTSTQKNPVHTYTSSGTYSVMLVVFNNNAGCRDTLIMPNLMDVDTPEADFFANTIFSSCPPFPVQFFNSTNRTDLQWLWYFGDGDTSSDRNPLHVYKFPGAYDVALVAFDSSGCRDSIMKLQYILVGGPIGNFTADPDTGCVPLTVTYSGTYSTNTIDIKADIGLGIVYDDTVDIVYTYTEPGKYYPVFTLTDSLGCVVSYPVDTIVVGLIPYPNLPADTSVCKGNYVQFYLPLGDFFLWEADQSPKYLNCDTCRDPLSTAPDTITYYVTATTSIGCVARDTITVNVDPLPPIFPGIFYRICPGDTLQLTAGAGVLAATWTPGMYIDDSLSVNPKVFPPDSMIYRVTGSNSTGCSISRIVRVYVIDRVVADLNISDTLVCDGGVVPLDLTVREASFNDTSYLWSPAQYLSSTTIQDPVVDAPFGDYTYTVIVSSSTCIPDTEQVHITVAPLPNLEAGDDQIVTPGTEVQIYAASPDQVSYSWTAVDELSCTTCRRPYITVNQSQVAYVVATNQWGCQTVDSVVLRVVECSPSMVFVPNTFTPNGDGLNDLLYVRGIGLRKLEYFRIYDRWGKLVYDSASINEGWDGTVNGKPADVAVYVYTAKGECSSGNSVEVKGNVTLVR